MNFKFENFKFQMMLYADPSTALGMTAFGERRPRLTGPKVQRLAENVPRAEDAARRLGPSAFALG